MRWPLALAPVALGAILSLGFRPPSPQSIPHRLNQTDQTRALAVRRGIHFIHSAALVPENLARFGQDIMLCFCTIATTSADAELRRTALGMGHEIALKWAASHQHPEPNSGPNALYQLAEGSHAAECLGVPVGALKGELGQAAARLTPEDIFGFDPAKEPPPNDIPRACRKCGARNLRGTRSCPRCGAALAMRDRYGVWCDALIVALTGERSGIRLGRGFADVVQWRPRLLPYPGPRDVEEVVYRNAAYSATHVVYAFSDYNRYRLRPGWLEAECDFLKSNLPDAIRSEDPELLGEFMDTLKSFGVSQSDPRIAAGTDFLLTHQNPDGSWGDPADADAYSRYHATWTALDGLRDYLRQGERVSMPGALRRARGLD